MKLFKPYSTEVKIIVASRYEETDLFVIKPVQGVSGLHPGKIKQKSYKQLLLFTK